MHPIIIGFLGALLPLVLQTSQNLEYEYATLMGWTLGILCLFTKGKSYLGSAITICAAAITVNIIAIIATPRQCHASGTLAWFFIQCVPAVFLGLSFKDSFQKNKLRWLTLATSVAFFSCFLFLWLSPQKRWVSIWFGYLHGPIYDDFVPLTFGIIVARLGHLFFALFVHYRTNPLLLAFLILFGVSLADPINQHGISALNRALPFTSNSEHVVLHFPDGQEDQMRDLFVEANFHVKDLSQILGIKLDKPMDIYVYKDKESKKILFGGSETDITDIVTPSIHIVADRAPHPTLRHEIVHGMLSQTSKLGFHFNMAITEGIAMALAPTDNILSMDQRSRHLLEQGKLPKVSDLFGPLFFIHASQVSYGVSGSFISWLLKLKPAQNFLDVYGGQDLSEAYGEELSSLYTRWQDYLKSVPYNREQMNALANHLLNAPSVFIDICPHSRIDFALAKNTLLRNRSENPSFYWSWLEKISPDDYELQDHRRNLARLGVNPSDGSPQTLLPHDSSNLSESDLSKDELAEIKTLQDYEDKLLQADLRQMKNDTANALKILSRLETLAMNPGRGLKRGLEIRLWILREARDNEKMNSYLFLLGKVAKPGFVNLAVEYLAGRQMYFKQDTNAEMLKDFPVSYTELNREIKIMNYRLAIRKSQTQLSLGYLASLITTEPNNAFWQLERKRTSFQDGL